MNVGDYVRTKSNGIQKIDEEGRINLGLIRPPFHIIKKEELLKSSPNIIDLIEEGDYVNGQKVTNEMIKMRDEQGVFGMPDKYHAFINEIKIKSIVTREQFSQMEYKVGE